MRLLSCTLLLILSTSVVGADDVIAPDAKLEKLWGEGAFTEGPVYGPGPFILWSDIGNRIMKYDPKTGQISVYREPSDKANGLDIDPMGRLVACEGAAGGKRRISITDPDGKVRTLADNWKGKKFNSPNDVTIDTNGRVYFSDPRYAGSEKREIDTESVYRIDPDGSVTQLITDVERPNGLIISPDMKTLYVADNSNKIKHLLAYPLKEDGSVGAKKVLYDFGKDRGIDGMAIDVNGNIYATAGQGKTTGVYVFSPEGKQLAFIPTPETATNCVFGHADRKMLYITGGKSLFRIPVKQAGFAVYWPKEGQ